MKSKTKDIIILCIFAALAIIMVVLDSVEIPFTVDQKMNVLIKDCLIRLLSSIFAVVLCILSKQLSILNPLKGKSVSAFIWTLPCLLVVIVNFPITALISQKAYINRIDLLWLFLIYCLLIGFLEEVLFRGIIQNYVREYCKNKPHSTFYTVFISSALFALWHLVNIFGGANVGYTLLQVCYSFLIGAMLSTCVIKTGNLWLCIILHALFDVGGLIVPTLGNGTFQDVYFWIATAICGILCFCHVLIYLYRVDKTEKKDNN